MAISGGQEQYLREFSHVISNRDGSRAAGLVSFSHPHILNSRLVTNNLEEVCQRVLSPPYDELVAAHLRCLESIQKSDFYGAYLSQKTAVLAFVKAFQSQKEENWALPIMYVLTLDNRRMAARADQTQLSRGVSKPGEILEKCAEDLMQCFRVCAADNRASVYDTKKRGMMFIVNQLFKIYFKTGRLQLCKPMVRAIDTLTPAVKQQFPLSQWVTFKYYVGRKAMFDGDLKTAEEYLSFSFKRCHRVSRRNKRLILTYLLPVKMLLGHLPATRLLKKYDLMQFDQVVKAVRSGNLRQLTEALQANEKFFIKAGIYLILEKLRLLTYRNLFKKVYLILRTVYVPLDAFVCVLREMGIEEADNDEAACLLANLISEGRIKGYIHHAQQKLVLSKKDPFPVLNTAL